MRNWKNWLFPILTCLTVAALALLPLRLSTLRDGELTETVHAEELSEDSNFPFKPPELPGRIWLLAQWEETPDALTIMAHELEGAERDREIQRLQEALMDFRSILPPDLAALLLALEGDSWNWDRYYLRDQTDLSSASFSVTGTYDKQTGISFAATLDGESGQIIGLQAAGADVIRYNSSPLEMGKALLDRLGLSYETIDAAASEEFYGSECFRLPESKSLFYVHQYEHGFFLGFQVDWELADSAAAEAYGYPTDSNPMQKW